VKRGLPAVAAAVLLPLALHTGAQDRAEQVSIRLGGKEVPVSSALRERLAGLAREITRRCGPNTLQHPHNFGPAARLSGERWQRVLEGSRLYVAYTESFESVSHLGGAVPVSEALIGLEDKELFVGPDFTRHRGVLAEHLQCEYLPSLELACLPELAPRLPARYRETCAKLERDAAGRIVMPPPDIAPSCS
jgi:hypothetical protein